jgi:uncharacterized membrane protein
MKFRPLLIAALALNAVLISAVAGALVGGLGAVRDKGVGRAAGLRAEAAAVVATNVAKEAVRLLVWRVKTVPLR